MDVLRDPCLLSTGVSALPEDACVDEDDFDAYLHARLDPSAVGELERHLARCSECRKVLSALVQAPGVTIAADGAPDGEGASDGLHRAPSENTELAVGARIGRYVVLKRLGAGGMGVVYAAHDPELDRQVALKVLRDPDAEKVLQERLRREAQAMARLAHPHVVTVHEVDTDGEQVFIAMELVKGRTFAAWLTEAPRSWREIVAELLPAGEGLAAAHAAGLIHRDFKPENVLVGDDGRVRVVDFGLARIPGVRELLRPRPQPSDTGPTCSGTGTGALMGTPFYMAPEQFLGAETEARTDQFSFCVALFTAIVGEHPFIGEDLESLSQGVLRGELRPPPRPDPLPRWLRSVLTRGLSVDPADRYPSMKDLLAALADDPRRRLRRVASVAVPALALAAAVVLASQAVNAPHRPCQGAEKAWAGIWDAERAAAVEKAFLATGEPSAAGNVARVERDLDAFAKAWAAAHTEACEATRVRGVQSEALLDKRMLCLETRLRNVRALIDRFVTADATTIERAPSALAGLMDLTGCADRQALEGLARLPAEPAARAHIAALSARVSEHRAARMVGGPGSGLAGARALLAEVRATGYRPLEAEMLYVLGWLEDDAGDYNAAVEAFEESVWAAEASRDDEQAVEAWTSLMIEVGIRQGRHDEALAMHPRVTALLERLDHRDDLEGNLNLVMAQLDAESGRSLDLERDAHAALRYYGGPTDGRSPTRSSYSTVDPSWVIASIAAWRATAGPGFTDDEAWLLGWCSQAGATFGTGDFDGNGKTDFYCHDPTGKNGGKTLVALSTGSGITDGTAWLAGWCSQAGATLGTGDFDGNGKTDLYCHDYPTLGQGGNTRVALSTGSGFATPGVWMNDWCSKPGATFSTGDFDGNGKTDFYCHDPTGTRGGKIRVALSTGSGIHDGRAWLSAWCSHPGATLGTGDFDGDGKTDFYCHDTSGTNAGKTLVALSTGSGITDGSAWLTGWCSHSGANLGTGDSDGDGKTDFYCHDFRDGRNSGQTWVALSTGSGFSTSKAWLSGWCSQNGASFGTGDFDANGTTDFYCHDPIGSGSGNTSVALSTGQRIVDGSVWLAGWCSHAGAIFGTGDFDGNGTTDLYCHDFRTGKNTGKTWVARARH